MAEVKLPMPTLPPGTPITIDNLAQAIAEMMAKLPDAGNAKPGAVYNEGGLLGAAAKE